MDNVTDLMIPQTTENRRIIYMGIDSRTKQGWDNLELSIPGFGLPMFTKVESIKI